MENFNMRGVKEILYKGKDDIKVFLDNILTYTV